MRLGIASCLALAAIPMMATGLFFDGGATLAAGTANAAVLGGLLAGKLAGLAGAGLLLGGRGRSNRGQHYTTSYHRPSYSRSYRHKREADPLFFDGGLTVAAGTANAAVLGGLLAGKLAGLAGAGLLLGGRGRSNRGRHYSSSYYRPSYRRSYRHKREADPLFFDGGLTVAAGTANAAVLGGLLAGKLAGLAGAGLLLGGRGRSNRGGHYSSSYYRPSYRRSSYRHKREADPLFFDGGLTVAAGTANAAVLGGLLAGKLAGLAGGALLFGGRGRSNRGGHYSSSYYRPSYRRSSYRHKREADPLFFDGGLTVAAGTANAAVLGGLLAGKLAGLAGGALLFGGRGRSNRGRHYSSSYYRPSYRRSSYRHKREADPLFFDGGLTVAAGTANAAVLGGLLAGKLAGLAGGALLFGGRGRSNRGRHYSSSYYRPSYRRSYRHKREEPIEVNVTALLEATFLDMAEQNTAGCFQRLFCDMSADPTKYEEQAPMMVAARLASGVEFTNPKANEVVQMLNQAISRGESTATFKTPSARVSMCEATYNKCQWTGNQMTQAISDLMQFESQKINANIV